MSAAQASCCASRELYSRSSLSSLDVRVRIAVRTRVQVLMRAPVFGEQNGAPFCGTWIVARWASAGSFSEQVPKPSCDGCWSSSFASHRRRSDGMADVRSLPTG
jgi:hypothetical protein